MQESLGPVSDRTQPARYRSSTDVPGNIVQNQPGSDLVLADCVTFCPNGSGPEAKPMCKNHLARFWPVLPSQSGSDANRIQHVYWEERRKTEPALEHNAPYCPIEIFVLMKCHGKSRQNKKELRRTSERMLPNISIVWSSGREL